MIMCEQVRALVNSPGHTNLVPWFKLCGVCGAGQGADGPGVVSYLAPVTLKRGVAHLESKSPLCRGAARLLSVGAKMELPVVM